MAVETELKLSIAPERIGRLIRDPAFRSLVAAKPVTRKLLSIYYDTPELDLHRNAMALRLRRNGRRWLQTLKGGGGVHAGLHRRNEWEMPVKGQHLDLQAFDAAGAGLPEGMGGRLQPVFVTEFTRCMYLLNIDGAQIELCLDSGEIRAGEKVRPIAEVELELKSGNPLNLFRLADKLLDVVPFNVEQVSKAEYGYRLFAGKVDAPVKASFPELDPALDVDAALRVMASACLRHAHANVPGAISGHDEEYLHQMRVGLRRLRVVLGMLEKRHVDVELHAVHEQVARMCSEFGLLREWDVFISQLLQPVCSRLPEHAGLAALLRSSKQRLARHRAKLIPELESADYQRLLLSFGAWMTAHPQRQEIQIGELAKYARQMLDRRQRQVQKRGEKLAHVLQKGRMPPELAPELHALRIACKKLRYSADMFGSLFDVRETRRFLDALAGLQDIMGVLNDYAVSQRQLAEMETPQRHETLALLRGWIEHERTARLAELRKAWKKFSACRRFWMDGAEDKHSARPASRSRAPA